MRIASDSMLLVKARLRDRIDQIARELPHMSRFALASEIDDVRRDAVRHGLEPLGDVASALESSLCDSNDQLIVLPFLELMRDSLDAAPTAGPAAAPYRIVAHQRLYG